MTTTNLKIVPRNFHDDASLTVSEAATDFPVTNTQRHIRDDAWRSTTTGTATVSGTFSANRTVDFFGMFRHRCHGGQIRVQLFSDAAWTTQVADTTTVAVNKVVGSSSDSNYQWGYDPYGDGGYDPLLSESPYWYWFASPVTVRSYRVTLSSHSLTYWPGAYWQVSRFWLGKSFSPRLNVDVPVDLQWASNDDRSRTRGGSLRSMLGARWRILKLRFPNMDETERAFWLDLMAYCQTGRDLVVSVFPGDGTRLERDYMLDGKLVSLDSIGHQITWLEGTLAVEEL